MRFSTTLAAGLGLGVGLGFALASVGAVAAQSTASLDFNNDAVHLDYAYQPNPRAITFDAGLYNHRDHSSYRRYRDGQLYYAGAMVKDQMANLRDVEFGLGGQIGYLDLKHVHGTFAGLSLQSKYNIPDAQGLSVTVGGTYAPSILTGSNLKNLWQARVEGGWQVVPQGEIFVGYRQIRVGVKHWDSISFEKGAYLGFRMSF
ncbi:Hypothetical protein HDN1F_34570 [gamma proteobacterium HdN1]|nr:Hypothetical protein HDN1F_34570 [gamma proteobacterium HdN1]